MADGFQEAIERAAPTTEWKFHLDYINDGDELYLPPSGVVEETHHDTGQLAVWWREPIRRTTEDEEDE